MLERIRFDIKAKKMASKALLVAVSALSLFAQAHAQTANKDETDNPIFVAIETDVDDLTLYIESLVDILNVVRFSQRRGEFSAAPTELEDIVFIAKRNAIRNGIIDEEILNSIAPEAAVVLKNSKKSNDFCHINRVDFENESIVFAIQTTKDNNFDPRCFHVAIAIHMNLEFNDIAKLSTEDAILKIFESLRSKE